ncbi:MAG: carboxylating nicotinate-nucleotide diphosphorylase [Pseudomonadota bacterium]
MPESVRAAITEDLGSGDVTAVLVDSATDADATVIVREHAVLCGRAWFDEVFAQVEPRARVVWSAADGDAIEPDQLVCTVQGPARGILSAERTALNFLQTLSGTATATARYVARVATTGCRILDTRKTIPGLRAAQKFAVRCGGGTNHRMGLYDAILIKENHIASAGSVAAAIEAARRANPGLPIEVEVETLEQIDEALATGVERLLLDNFDHNALAIAVQRNARAGQRRAELEASGNMTEDDLVDVAATGVDFISVGALTKHVRATDFSMRFEFGSTD